MKITVLDGYSVNPGDLTWAGLEALGDLTVYPRTPMTDSVEIVRRIGDAEAVLTNKVHITEEILAACPSVRYVGALATGYNVIDTAAARRRNIPVTNIPAYSTPSVAQHTFALLLEICHHVWHHSEEIHHGRFSRTEDWCFWDYPLIELSGKTMGIIGLGSIGCAVAGIARAMGMRVLAYSRTRREERTELAEYCSLEALLADSDVVSLHCPLFPETHGLINRRSIEKMRTGAILLNCGRGPLIVEQDVADALNSGKLYAAGLDVADTDPISPDSPLLTAKNCIITPHIAWAPLESRRRLMETAVGNLEAFLSGQPRNVVN